MCASQAREREREIERETQSKKLTLREHAAGHQRGGGQGMAEIGGGDEVGHLL